MENKQLSGIHHVTAIASDPQQNVDFYTRVLGLRLVKVTINYDDPGTYHFYYGDEAGSPGSILTFFAWPGTQTGKRGTRQVTTTVLSIPQNAEKFWIDRLNAAGVNPALLYYPDGNARIYFYDPDGLRLELVTRPEDSRPGFTGGDIEAKNAICGLDSVVLTLTNAAPTDKLLTEIMSIRRVAEFPFSKEDLYSEYDSADAEAYTEIRRYEVGPGGPGSQLEIRVLPEGKTGRIAAGTVHHVAWRTPDDVQQQAWHETLAAQGHQVSPVMDRQYFHSIYFREPGGVLFEIATDSPGFATDETLAELGTSLRLPSWLEPHREKIQQGLPPLRLPNTTKEK